MSADNRSVTTDALHTLGTIIDDKQKRDAIHLAVEPVIAGMDLEPGDHVTIEDGYAIRVEEGKGLGIVDPFLTNYISRGERFWFIMYPRTITSLRHVWSHPAFKDEAGTTATPSDPTARDAALAWIRNYAEDLNVGFRDLMDSAALWVETHDGKWGGEYMVRGGTLEGESTSDEFWRQYEIATDKTLPEDVKQNFFSCSC